MESNLLEIMEKLEEDVLVFYLGNGWQVHVWKDGKVYLQGLKFEDGKHWITFIELKANLQVSKSEFIKRIKEILKYQTFKWEVI